MAIEYWLANVPVRLTFLFVVTAYAYLFKVGGTFGPAVEGLGGVGELLQNSLVFSWGFFEMVMWFWVSSHLLASVNHNLLTRAGRFSLA